jgi:hypothetical protein
LFHGPIIFASTDSKHDGIVKSRRGFDEFRMLDCEYVIAIMKAPSDNNFASAHLRSSQNSARGSTQNRSETVHLSTPEGSSITSGTSWGTTSVETLAVPAKLR